ncbi:MAG: FUSC family protein [Gaiellales bacterium]
MTSTHVQEQHRRLILFGSTWDWRETHWRLPLLETMIFAVFVAGAIAAGLERYALTIGMTAAFVGLVGGARPSERQGRSLLLAALFMTIDATLGAAFAPLGVWVFLPLMLIGLIGGYVGAIGPRWVVIGTASMAQFAIQSGQPQPPGAVLDVALVVGISGFALVAIVMAPIILLRPQRVGAPGDFDVPPLQRLRLHLHRRDPFLRHAIRLAIALAIGSLLSRVDGLPHGFWIPLTLIFVLQPDRSGTVHHVAERILGTLLGVAVMVAYVKTLHPTPYALVITFALGALVMSALSAVNYSLTVFGITLGLLSGLAIKGEAIDVLAEARIGATLIAGALAIAAAFIGSTRIDPVPLASASDAMGRQGIEP